MIGVGQQLGGYTILHRIGQGGMGDVYLAQHRRVARRAAVKVLLPELSQKATVLDRFFNEARATSLIKHPGIVEILDCDVLDDQAFIIMEYLEGESLGEYLHRTGALVHDLPFLLGVASGIASAVGAAHTTGIIHRDLKPDNVYLHLGGVNDPTVTVKILDFGIAKLAQQEGGTSQTKTGMLLGTPAYMSPEQCRGAGQVDLRSDIYSLGCILYELVCGTPPFVHEGAGDMIIAHVSEPPEPPSARVPAVASTLNTLIMRMLGKKPEQRPQSMDEVLAELAACAVGLGVAIDRPLRPRAPVERPAGAEQWAQAGAGGVPRSQVTPLPGSGAIAAATTQRQPTQPTPFPAPQPSRPGTGPNAALEAQIRSRPGTGPNAVLEPQYRSRPGTGPNAVLEPSGPVVGGTRVMETVRPTTTMGSAAAELRDDPLPAVPRRGKMFAMAAAAVVLVGGAIAVIGTRGGSPSKNSASVATAATEPAVAAPPAAAPEKLPAAPEPAPTPEPKPIVAAAAQPALPSTVRIDLQGVPARTSVTVDGRAATLPLTLPRGPAVHHIVLRPPSGSERTLDLDGTKDRLVELMFERHASGEGAAPSRGGASESTHRSSGSGSSHGSGKKKAGASDREAITDI